MCHRVDTETENRYLTSKTFFDMHDSGRNNRDPRPFSRNILSVIFIWQILKLSRCNWRFFPDRPRITAKGTAVYTCLLFNKNVIVVSEETQGSCNNSVAE